MLSPSMPARSRSSNRRSAAVLACGAFAILVLVAWWQREVPAPELGNEVSSRSVAAREAVAMPAVGPLAVPEPSERLLHDSAAPATSSEPAAASLAYGTVVLRAVAAPSSAPIPAFTWTAAGTVRGMEPRGESDGPVATLRVPLDLPAMLRVAAAGFRESLAVDVSLRGTQFREVEVALLPAPSELPIRIRVQDRDGRPVTRVRVRCEHRELAGEDRRAWQLRWTRESI
ncbi:MAG: hypothetical protein ABL997_18415, partial [Planctomycetota bacterium]